MGLDLKVSGAQTVTPRMIEAMAVLQCGVQELKERLEELSYENPMMELQEPEAEPPALTADKLRWLQGADHQNAYYADRERSGVDQYLPSGTADSLPDFLREQIMTADASPALRRAMETVADLLDDRGLYAGSAAEIAGLAACSEALADEALRRVRAMEPPGVAAESIPASLLAQLALLEPKDMTAEQLVREQFAHLASWAPERLARALGASPEAVRAAKKTLAGLTPYPANGFAVPERIQYVAPDLYILPGEEGLTVVAEERYLPTIRVNAEYLRMLETQQDEAVKKYLRQKLGQVERLMTDVARRSSTLQRCGEVVARRQAAFLAGGELAALTLREVAEELELHESTISRAVKNKYVQCRRGLLPLSDFFQREAGENYGMGRSQLQSVLAQVIAGENPEKPLSDAKLAEELARRHIKLSRRGVAKYRAELGIPPAGARKEARGL